MDTLRLWQRLSAAPGGKWAFSKLLCAKAPYFGSISPRFEELRPECCTISVLKHRAVLNHLGTVHAIAMCNMAELAGGMMTEVTIPSTHRWIPKGMTVEYLKKAGSDLRATARPAAAANWSQPGEYKVVVDVVDQNDQPVFKGLVTMWVSPKTTDQSGQ